MVTCLRWSFYDIDWLPVQDSNQLVRHVVTFKKMDIDIKEAFVLEAHQFLELPSLYHLGSRASTKAAVESADNAERYFYSPYDFRRLEIMARSTQVVYLH